MIPDHSLIKWRIDFISFISRVLPKNDDSLITQVDKFDFKGMPSDFMNTDIIYSKILSLIEKFENSEQEQNCVNDIYDEFCKTVKNEMYEKVPNKTVYMGASRSGRKCRNKKPWWNEGLNKYWTKMCEAEKAWKKSDNGRSKEYKAIYVKKRKNFGREVQKCKRKYWFSMQEELLLDSGKNQQQFWKKIGKIGIAENRKSIIPIEVLDSDGKVCTDLTNVLNRWKADYSNLLNQEISPSKVYISSANIPNNDTFNDFLLTDPISFTETMAVIEKAKKEKSPGYDILPAETFLNNTSALFLYHLFDFCFKFGKTPDLWNKIIINPIPKSNMADLRDPLSYRGIALASVSYKLYCNILNDRLSQWVDDNNLLADEQNGFRQKRSTVDQISTLTSIIDIRKKLRKSTFCAFIDFKKPYETIHRDILWSKLNKLGIAKTFCAAIQSITLMFCVQ